ncbi:spermidine/putrescine ABC transporter ATP-binding protein, partial [Candidatus Nomurabacteria bacterium]|nr:spermidine/putrescine ABC transporter ATP-binding protein [Candidatus Nomurabacteria bacterium]
FAALDFYTKLRLEDEFWNIVQKKKKSAILVTHDIDEAIAISHRILIMGNSPDGIVKEFEIDFGTQDRSPDLLRGHPKFADYFNSIWSELKEKTKNG